MYKYNSVVVDSDGELLVWTDGSMSGSNEAKKKAIRASRLALPVTLVHGVPPVEASLEDTENYLAVTAALFAAAPGRSRLLEAPESVTEWFESYADEEGLIY